MNDIGNPRIVAANEGGDTLPEQISRSARMLIENAQYGSDPIGFVSLAVYADGSYSCGFRCPEDHPIIGPALFTAYVKEIVERQLTGKQAAEEYAREFLL